MPLVGRLHSELKFDQLRGQKAAIVQVTDELRAVPSGEALNSILKIPDHWDTCL